MGKLEGKVAFITGAARGQGRSHAVRLAEEGADIIAVDLCEDVASIAHDYSMATPADLEETVRLVEKTGAEILAQKADVRNYAQLKAAADNGIDRFGHVDICLGNAGVFTSYRVWEYPEETWDEIVGICLKGVWNTVRAVIPFMIERGQGGAIVLTGSTAGVRGYAHTGAYSAAKHGVVGLMKSLAAELAPYWIRVNVVHPTNCNTTMLQNPGTYKTFMPDLENPTREDLLSRPPINLMPIHWVEPEDVSAAILWLVSDDARYITGSELAVDGGSLLK